MNLGIVTWNVGEAAETYIRRHIEELAPRRTVVVAEGITHGYSAHCPVFCLNPKQPPGNLFLRVADRLAHGSGILAPRTFTRRIWGLPRLRLKHFLRSKNVGVILGEFLDASLRFLPIARELGIAFYGHAHGYDISKNLRNTFWRREYLKYNNSDGVIVMSHAAKRSLMEIGIREDKVFVIPYGVVVPEHFLPRRVISTVRVLAAGRMVAKKAPLKLLEAFRIAQGQAADLHLDYLGGGPLLEVALEYAKDHGLAQAVTFHGARAHGEVLGAMDRADVFIQHSIRDPATGDEEGLPLGILEAMAHGLPIISTRHAGIPEAVEEGKTGFLVDEGDVWGMAKSLMALAADNELRLQMGKQAWMLARSHFSWETERQKLLSLLRLPQS